MSSTTQTKEDIDKWNSVQSREDRYRILKYMSVDADIEQAFDQVPELHLKNMSYEQYLINVYAMGKIKAMLMIASATGNE